MKRLISGSVMFLTVGWAAAGTVFAAPNIKEGNWEQTMEMKMEGMPFPVQPMTFKGQQCLTKKDLVPATAKKDEKCEVKDQKIVGDKVTWRIKCVDKDVTTEGQGEVTYSGTTYKGTMKSKITYTNQPSPPMTATSKLSGRRLGECKK